MGENASCLQDALLAAQEVWDGYDSIADNVRRRVQECRADRPAMRTKGSSETCVALYSLQCVIVQTIIVRIVQ